MNDNEKYQLIKTLISDNPLISSHDAQLAIDFLEQRAADLERELRAYEATVENLEAKVSAMAAENAGLKGSLGIEFFAYCNELGFERHIDKEAAIADAQSRIDSCRENAEEGWPEEVESICWGVIVQQAAECNQQQPSEDNDWLGSVDYRLNGRTETSATDAAIAEIMAQGVEMFALMLAEMAIKRGETSGWKSSASNAASDYAQQLRAEESK